MRWVAHLRHRREDARRRQGDRRGSLIGRRRRHVAGTRRSRGRDCDCDRARWRIAAGAGRPIGEGVGPEEPGRRRIGRRRAADRHRTVRRVRHLRHSRIDAGRRQGDRRGSLISRRRRHVARVRRRRVADGDRDRARGRVSAGADGAIDEAIDAVEARVRGVGRGRSRDRGRTVGRGRTHDDRRIDARGRQGDGGRRLIGRRRRHVASARRRRRRDRHRDGVGRRGSARSRHAEGPAIRTVEACVRGVAPAVPDFRQTARAGRGNRIRSADNAVQRRLHFDGGVIAGGGRDVARRRRRRRVHRDGDRPSIGEAAGAFRAELDRVGSDETGRRRIDDVRPDD